MDQIFFTQKFFVPKILLDSKFSNLTHKYLEHNFGFHPKFLILKLVKTKKFWPKIFWIVFLLSPIFFWIKNIFWPNFFSDKIFFALKNLLNPYFFYQKFFFIFNIFYYFCLPQHFLNPKILFGTNIFWPFILQQLIHQDIFNKNKVYAIFMGFAQLKFT